MKALTLTAAAVATILSLGLTQGACAVTPDVAAPEPAEGQPASTDPAAVVRTVTRVTMENGQPVISVKTLEPPKPGEVILFDIHGNCNAATDDVFSDAAPGAPWQNLLCVSEYTYVNGVYEDYDLTTIPYGSSGTWAGHVQSVVSAAWNGDSYQYESGDVGFKNTCSTVHVSSTPYAVTLERYLGSAAWRASQGLNACPVVCPAKKGTYWCQDGGYEHCCSCIGVYPECQ
jgi:hypothetical protein